MMAGMESDKQKVFKTGEIDEVFSKDPAIMSKFTVRHDPSMIIMAVDPNAGGDSETAIVSGYFIHERNNATTFTGVILGIDAERTTDPVRQQELVVQHIAFLQAKFPRKKIVVIPENQTGFFHEEVVNWIGDMAGVQVLYQKGERAGVRKDSVKTRQYVMCLQEVFAQKAFKFDSQWFTLSIPLSANINTTLPSDYYLNAMKDGLKAELVRFGYDEKKKLTGKVKGSSSISDDRAIALMMFFYWGRTILTNVPNNPHIHLIPMEARHLLTVQGIQSQGRAYMS